MLPPMMKKGKSPYAEEMGGAEMLPPTPSPAGEAAMAMGEEPGEYQDQDEGGAKVGGGPGPGVKVVGQNIPDTECLMKFPLTGPFWFRPPKQGQA